MNLSAHSFRTVFIALCLLVTSVQSADQMHGPDLTFNMSTSCDEFSQTARFNPYAMVDGTWVVFYYWAPPRPLLMFRFFFIKPEDYEKLHEFFDGKVSVPVNWTARHVAIWEKGSMALLVETGDRGQYLMYYPIKMPEGKLIEPVELRFKQTGDNKVVGMMECETLKVYAMSRMENLPRKKDIQDAAARLNYRGRDGKSYLYAGHHWMPVPEMDEHKFWSKKPPRRFMYE